jgi:hypothetical protein
MAAKNNQALKSELVKALGAAPKGLMSRVHFNENNVNWVGGPKPEAETIVSRLVLQNWEDCWAWFEAAEVVLAAKQAEEALKLPVRAPDEDIAALISAEKSAWEGRLSEFEVVEEKVGLVKAEIAKCDAQQAAINDARKYMPLSERLKEVLAASARAKADLEKLAGELLAGYKDVIAWRELAARKAPTAAEQELAAKAAENPAKVYPRMTKADALKGLDQETRDWVYRNAAKCPSYRGEKTYPEKYGIIQSWLEENKTLTNAELAAATCLVQILRAEHHEAQEARRQAQEKYRDAANPKDGKKNENSGKNQSERQRQEVEVSHSNRRNK